MNPTTLSGEVVNDKADPVPKTKAAPKRKAPTKAKAKGKTPTKAKAPVKAKAAKGAKPKTKAAPKIVNAKPKAPKKAPTPAMIAKGLVDGKLPKIEDAASATTTGLRATILEATGFKAPSKATKAELLRIYEGCRKLFAPTFKDGQPTVDIRGNAFGAAKFPRVCPNCAKTKAADWFDLAIVFGVRCMNGKLFSQPWCRPCRAGKGPAKAPAKAKAKAPAKAKAKAKAPAKAKGTS
jgi:hypothetical protein